MKHTLKSVRTLAASLITIGSLAGGANAAVVANVNVLSSSAINVTLSGLFSGPVATSFPREVVIDFGTFNYVSNITPSAISGSYSVAGANGILYNNSFTIDDAMLVILAPSAFAIGDLISGSVLFEYSTPHRISVGQSFNVYWGTSGTGAGATLQSAGVTAVPELSSGLLVCLGALGLVARRRTSRG